MRPHPALHQKIAVIGGGVAGLSAAHLLGRKHDVTLFEASAALGGHAHAERMIGDDGAEFWVDTAFLIFNERTYPNFQRFLTAIGLPKQDISAEMSSCFSDENNRLHYSLGQGWTPVFKNPGRYLKFGLAKILRDLVLFRRRARADLASGKDLTGVTAHEYLGVYSEEFRENFVLPLTAAIWSLSGEQMGEFPILSILQYFDNHQLLGGKSEKRWRTFPGSSVVYVRAFERSFRGTVRTSTPVKEIKREPDGVHVRTAEGSERFDQVVIATHADQTLRLLANPTAEESRLLGAWRYQDTPATLHSDVSVLHPDPALWSSWNMVRRENEPYRISYYLNRLQKLPTKTPMILTLGERDISERAGPAKRFRYHHPIFDRESVATQASLPGLNGVDRIYFAGSYFGHGFHEDAVNASVEVARAFALDWSA